MCYVISMVLDEELDNNSATEFLNDHGLYIPDITSNVTNAKPNIFYYQIQIGGCSCGILEKRKKELNILFNNYIKSNKIKIMINEYNDNLHKDIQILIDKAKDKKLSKLSEFLKLNSYDIEYNVLYTLFKE